ncbi:unnamed protein product [Urochloa decumbens]|uniref:F-box domain-containing protein n=1 Tax=Urochloa decumbens TaxID=240449 RepID=A0ABC8YL67_9POAL
MSDKEAPPQSTASGGDRISALPDGVRELVLSFLPAHEAVRMAVVARSWRDLWMRSPALRITEWGSFDKFNQFVECLLRLRCTAPVSGHHPSSDPRAAPALLDSCHFNFGTLDFFNYENMIQNEDIYKKLVNYWFKCALCCQVRVLQYCFSQDCGFRLELVDLTLISGHLTKLELAGVSLTDDNVDLSGCPVLWDLKVEHCYIEIWEIQSPYLQHLRMANCSFLIMSGRTLIRVPSLISLELTECSGRAPFLDSMPSLAAAVVTFYSDDSDDRCRLSSIDVCGSDDCKGCECYYYADSSTDRINCLLLNGLSEATNLELSAYPETVVFRRDLKFAHTFGKLKTLVLADWFVADDLSALIWFLHHSPILEKLTLHISKVHENAITAEQICKLPEPSVASSLLKIAEIKCHQVDGIVIEILKILTAYGVPVEQINIQCSAGSGYVNFKCTGFSVK